MNSGSNSCHRARSPTAYPLCQHQQHGDPDPEIDRYDPVAFRQDLRKLDRLPRKLPPGPAGKEEGLVALGGGDGVADGGQRHHDHISAELRQEQCPPRSEQWTAEELERLESFERSILPGATERG